MFFFIINCDLIKKNKFNYKKLIYQKIIKYIKITNKKNLNLIANKACTTLK